MSDDFMKKIEIKAGVDKEAGQKVIDKVTEDFEDEARVLAKKLRDKIEASVLEAFSEHHEFDIAVGRELAKELGVDYRNKSSIFMQITTPSVIRIIESAHGRAMSRKSLELAQMELERMRAHGEEQLCVEYQELIDKIKRALLDD